jgi:gamma-glutamylcyclotransferase (GGCT)/AIG2-like uncharacterized protein YtfP
MAAGDDRLLVFAYGSLRKGESDHGALEAAEFVGNAHTVSNYRLVDLGVYPAMIEFKGFRVFGEVYAVTRDIRRHLDVLKEVPVLFQRVTIGLEDGRTAEAYVMREQQVRGRRRLRVEDWKQRFAPLRRA